MSKRKIALVFGTRPEIIKLSPVIRCLQKTRTPFFLLHTAQHYSYKMDRLFFKELQLPPPQYHLKTPKGLAQTFQTASMLAGVERVLSVEKPGAVLVQGDTNSVLSGALVAVKRTETILGHVEAGLRSYDREMPEEINRVVTDHCSDMLFAPTRDAAKLLTGEGIDRKKIYITGNTIVDAVRQNLRIALQRRISVAVPKRYALMTLHRQENVDHKTRFKSILEGVAQAAEKTDLPILFPIHPRTSKRIKEFGLRLPAAIKAMNPVGFLDFLPLEARAALILTDSGGIQEEACILGTPCVTLRTTTERPETIAAGGNRLAGYDSRRILRESFYMLKARKPWNNPFGDGHAADRIVRITRRHLR